MNRQSLETIFRNYIDNFDYFDTLGEDGHETYKWDAVEQVQKVWDLQAVDLSMMIRSAFSKTYNLLNNRYVSPGNGLALLAEKEPEAVRKALRNLLEETDDVDEKQDKIIVFVDEINRMLEKHFPGKWKYTHYVRDAVTYLALINPSENYLFKSTPAQYFARWTGFEADIGAGKTFKLKYYYQMCDELLEIVNASPELLEKNTERKTSWKDESHHILVTDLIYCFASYDFMRKGIDAPPASPKKDSLQARLAERARKAAELQENMSRLQDELDTVETEIAGLPPLDFEGRTIRTKPYGDVVVDRQEGNYLTFTANGKERNYSLPGCVCDGFVLTDDSAVLERCRKEADCMARREKLSSQQRLTLIELGDY